MLTPRFIPVASMFHGAKSPWFSNYSEMIKYLLLDGMCLGGVSASETNVFSFSFTEGGDKQDWVTTEEKLVHGVL